MISSRITRGAKAMNEKILENRKNGMAILLLVILGYVFAVVGLIFAVNFGW